MTARAEPPSRLTVVAPPPLPVEALVIGKPVTEVVELIPRLFSLCRHAQSIAVKMACGIAVEQGAVEALSADICRDHRLRLHVMLPAVLGMDAEPPDISCDMDLSIALAKAPILARVAELFGPGQAVSRDTGPENSVAGRRTNAPLMREIEALYGRGPLWRVTARCLELAEPDLPAVQMMDGWAVVPTARGAYRVRAQVHDNIITRFERRTPTDDMLAPGGPIETALATLHDPSLGPLLLETFDPCVPLELKEAAHA